MKKTNSLFTDDFEGFNIDVGEKRFKYSINNPKNVAETQSNLNTLLGKFLDNKGNVNDHEAYHKAMYAARNVDTIAEHFYEQGKADAIKDLTAKSNNVTTTRSTPSGSVDINGWKVKAITGADSSKLKIKNKNLLAPTLGFTFFHSSHIVLSRKRVLTGDLVHETYDSLCKCGKWTPAGSRSPCRSRKDEPTNSRNPTP